MKGIVIVLILVVIGVLFFSSCTNNKSIPYQNRVYAIVGDCISDSLYAIIDIQIRKLGWDYQDSVLFLKNDSNYYKKIIKFIKKSNRNIEVISQWRIDIKKNKLTVYNYWFEEYGWGPSGYNTLATDNQDTSFWNVIDILRIYCEVRDTSYIIDMSPELKLNDQND